MIEDCVNIDFDGVCHETGKMCCGYPGTLVCCFDRRPECPDNVLKLISDIMSKPSIFQNRRVSWGEAFESIFMQAIRARQGGLYFDVSYTMRKICVENRLVIPCKKEQAVFFCDGKPYTWKNKSDKFDVRY